MATFSIICQSPGRINLIGEHTDYNEGFVLPAAIDKGVEVRLNRNGNPTVCHIYAANMEETLAFDLKNFTPLQNGWQNYIMGVVRELQNLGAKLEGFDAKFEGTVPIGSGMSSSAALECSLAFGLNELFDLGFDKWQLIKAAQLAEHHFVGIKCGIMDQFASMMGKENKVMLLDCRSLDFDYFELDLGDFEILLLNTNVSHELASSEYNTRRAECEAGVAIIQKKYPQVKSLRDVPIQMLQEFTQMPEIVKQRCHHVISENARVLASTTALHQQDLQKFGQLIYDSHFSLQHDYEVSCPELDFLVEQTLDKNYILGARMMGGGFGGCTLNLIEKKQSNAFINMVAKNYQKAFGYDLTPYFVSIKNGTSLV